MNKLFYIAHMRLPTERAHGFQILRMCAAFASNEFEVTLVVPSRKTTHTEDPFSFYKLQKTFAIERVFSLDLFPFKWISRALCFWIDALTFSLSLFTKISRLRRSIVFSRDPVSAFFLMWCVPHLCYEVHDTPRFTFFNRVLFHRLKKIVVTNAIKKQQLIETFGVHEDRMFVAHHGVDHSQFSMSISKTEARKKLGFGDENKYVVYTGHLFDWKGVYTLARAVRYLPEDAHIVVVGGTPEDIARFNEFVVREDLKRIHNVGLKPHNEIPLYLAMADVLVLPTSGQYLIGKLESSPLKLLEYMAAKRAVVASDLPAVREIVTEREVVFVAPDNARLLSEALTKTIQSDMTPRIDAAFARVEKQTWESRASHILTFIETQ